MTAHNESTTGAGLITITPAAAAQVKAVLAERQRPDAALRIFIAGRTCSGFQYGMALADGPDEDDILVEDQGVRFVIDNVSAPFLSGAQVDFIETEMARGFTINNPNAGGGCGCGGGGCSCGHG
jgi:iron-sulfur cluster assembly protein